MTTRPRLTPATLVHLPAEVRRPGAGRANLQPGIVHLGLGAFARAHLAAVTEAALDADPRGVDARWGIVGVSLRQPDTLEALQAQQGLYTLALCDADAMGMRRQRLQVLGCVLGVLHAPASPGAVLEAIAAPSTRIVSLTVTEKGYLRDPASGEMLHDHPELIHDLAHPGAPLSAPGFIVHGLALRWQRGLGPIALLSLDNLPANGDSLKRVVLALATRADPALATWIEAGCTFPNSMVDRIVPRTTQDDRESVGAALGLTDAWPVIAEPFLDWAVEDRFPAGRPAWEAGGARFVPRAEPWERCKLRMVNGAHSALAYLGLMAGWHTVDMAVSQPCLRAWLQGLWAHEVEPTLPHLASIGSAAYRQRLLERFANPALAHRTRQIAMDGSQKLPQRLLAPIRERLAAGQDISHLALAVAAWANHLRGRDENGHTHAIEDPLAGALQALHQRAEHETGAEGRARVYTSFAPVFADLANHPGLVQAMAAPLQSLRERGVTATLAASTRA